MGVKLGMQNFSHLLQAEHFQIGFFWIIEWTGGRKMCVFTNEAE